MIGLREDAALRAALKNYLDQVLMQARTNHAIHSIQADKVLLTNSTYRSMARTHHLRGE